MDAPEIHERLKAKFGAAIGDVITDNPDPFILVEKAAVAGVCAFLKSEEGLEFDFLESISGLDDTEKLQIVYHLFSYKHRHAIVIKADVPYDDLEVPSCNDVWRAADWHEREQFDLFGFLFTNHPDLRRIMLPEDWVGHPLRKDYVYPESYHGIEHDRDDPMDQFKALDELTLKARAAKKEQASDA